ncbi:MAG: hypothetical protein JRI97_02370 [Deltaproteobacteria bacterium]|nr:hypothetical protein [Deltaproteobacteria bacterium]
MKRNWPRRFVLGSLVAALTLWSLSGCAAKREPVGEEQAQQALPATESRVITDIWVTDTDDTSGVMIKGSGPLNTTWVENTFIPSLVLFFEDATLGDVPRQVTPEGGAIKRVVASQSNGDFPAVRVEIVFGSSVPYEVVEEDSQVRVVFDTTALPPEEEEQARAEEPPPLPKAKPETEETGQEAGKEPAPSPGPAPSHAGVVLDGGATPEMPVDEKPVEEAESSAAKAVWVEEVNFDSAQDGRSTVSIKTSGPVDYEVAKSGPRRVLVNVYGARIPKEQQRPLITTRFESAVDRISPAQKTPDTVSVLVELREQVPYHVEQKEGELLLHLEPSRIPPRPLAQASLPDWEKALTSTLAEEAIKKAREKAEKGVTGEGALSETGAGIMDTISADTLGQETGGVKYTGEKIALDFYKTDVKNVFRILKDVSGLNFAVDRDVTGEVTLSLEKPVPWDQVLHLVLKMNQLGMVRYGDIIRIAPIATLDAEQKAAEERRQARIEAEKAAREAEEARLAAEKAAQELEPLVTVYIPVNYTSAADLQAHINEIKTPDRGRLSVDTRTNTLIMTDTQDKIDRAMEIVDELDRVTPQVMIEARIVEASTQFSREIGLDWGGEVGVQPGSARAGIGPQRGFDILGGTYGFNWAVNHPFISSQNPIGFNFTRIMGLTPLELNATLKTLEARGSVKIVSAPKVLTLDNKTAMIKQGVEYPVPTVDDAGNTVIEYRDVDLLLEVTPHVTRDRRVSMKIVTTKNDIGDQVAGGVSFTTKEAETELLVNDGDTVVIGGIIKTSDRYATEGLPGLMDIPILGWLFKSNARLNQREELLVFITPRIVDLEER